MNSLPANTAVISTNPDELLSASERAGGRPSGRIIPLGCLENKVFWLPSDTGTDHIVKVYRHGRWRLSQLDVEHDFLCELDDRGIPVSSPIDLGDGYTIGEFYREDGPLYYAVFPRLEGRMKDELSLVECEHLGSLLADVHQIALSIDGFEARRPKDQTEALRAWLSSDAALSDAYRVRGLRWLKRIESSPIFSTQQLIHGDCHLGNIIWNGDEPALIDFDDCGLGWCGQDLWMMAPGDDAAQIEKRRVILEGYGGAVSYHQLQENLVLLRSLRMLNYTRWIASRWPDPAFVHAYPDFGRPVFYTRECSALDELESRWQA